MALSPCAPAAVGSSVTVAEDVGRELVGRRGYRLANEPGNVDLEAELLT